MEPVDPTATADENHTMEPADPTATADGSDRTPANAENGIRMHSVWSPRSRLRCTSEDGQSSLQYCRQHRPSSSTALQALHYAHIHETSASSFKTKTRMASNFNSLLWLLFLTVLVTLVGRASCQDVARPSPGPVIVDEPFRLNPNDCLEMFDTVNQVVYVCGNHPDLYPILMYAEQMAQIECEKQFKDELWNCSGYSLLKEPNVTRGGSQYKEGAFVDALSFTVIAYTVSKACSQGLLEHCDCHTDEDLIEELEEQFPDVVFSNGCSDNIEYGIEVAKIFLNERYLSGGHSLRHELIQHNFDAAEALIRGITQESPECICHGISGSCTFKHCYNELPEFEVFSEQLKALYDEACEVTPNGHTNNAFISECNRAYTNEDLIYRHTYDWCIPHPSVGSVGVVGRECDPNSSGPNSCQNLCRDCNRVPEEHTETVVHKCDCSFYFCCRIHCETCIDRRTYYTCS